MGEEGKLANGDLSDSSEYNLSLSFQAWNFWDSTRRETKRAGSPGAVATHRW